MSIDVVLNLFFSALDLIIQIGDQFTQRLNHVLGFSAFEPINLLLFSLREILEMARQGLQLTQVGRWWHPGGRLLLLTKATDQASVGFVILIAQQFALPEGFNLGWIYDTYRMALLLQ